MKKYKFQFVLCPDASLSGLHIDMLERQSQPMYGWTTHRQTFHSILQTPWVAQSQNKYLNADTLQLKMRHAIQTN